MQDVMTMFDQDANQLQHHRGADAYWGTNGSACRCCMQLI